MTENYVVLCKHWEPKRMLFYDFSEQEFYIDTLERTHQVKNSKHAFIVFGSTPIIVWALGFTFRLFYLPNSPHMQPFATVAAMMLSTVFAYLLYRGYVKGVLKNKIGKARIFSFQLDRLQKKRQKRMLQTAAFVALAMAMYIFSIWHWSSSPTEDTFARMVGGSWAAVVATVLIFMPHKQLKFHRQLKRGEIWIDGIPR